MGKLIVFEGTDGSGKATQLRMLADRLRQAGSAFRTLEFPQYEKPSSALVRMYLAGAFGAHPEDVNAYAASMFFSVDRFASYQQDWRDYYAQGGILLADRYTTSNAVHQAAKLPPQEQKNFFSWLYDLEFCKMGLPKPDLVLFLDVPIAVTEQLLQQRSQQTGAQGDIHEKDLDYLRLCRKTAQAAADYYGWKKIECVEQGQLCSIAQIHEKVYAQVRACL